MTLTVWGNVGVADKGEGHPLKKGASCPLRNIADSDKKTDEKQDTAVRHPKKTKQDKTSKI